MVRSPSPAFLRDDSELGAWRHHSHAAIKTELASFIEREREDSRAVRRQQLSDSKLWCNEDAAATCCLAGVDSPFNRDALRDREAVRDVFKINDAHHHDLLTGRGSLVLRYL